MKKKKNRVKGKDVLQVLDGLHGLLRQTEALAEVRNDLWAIHLADAEYNPQASQWAKLQSQQIGENIRQVTGLINTTRAAFQNILDTGALDGQRPAGNDEDSLKQQARPTLAPDREVGFESLVKSQNIES